MSKGIRKRLIDLDMNQGDLAALLGVSPAYVSAVLTGKKSPSVDFMDALERNGFVQWRDAVRRVMDSNALPVTGLSEQQVAGLMLYVENLKARTR